MSRRTRRTNTRESEPAAPGNLDAAVSILNSSIQVPKLKFKKIAESDDFIPILHYCAITVKRFCQDPVAEVRTLLESARRSETPALTVEFFLVEIFIINDIPYNDNLATKVAEVYPTFTEDLQIAQEKTKTLAFFQGAKPKPRGARQVDDSLPDKQMVSIYVKNVIEYWTLILEFHRYQNINFLIQELNKNKDLPFPDEFLQAQFRGSEESLNVFKEYIINFFDDFFADKRWYSFIENTPELINYIITEVMDQLKPEQIKVLKPLYIPFLTQFFQQIYLGKSNVQTFVDFVVLTGDEMFVNILDTNPDIAAKFKEFFVTNFDKLFANKKWCKFTESSQLLIKFIVLHLYATIPIEKKKIISGLNERLLDNLLLDEEVSKVVEFFLGLPPSFFLLQFEWDDPTAQNFKRIFTINFDNYIIDDRLRQFILSDDDVLDLILHKIIPFTDTKKKDMCVAMFEEYLKRKLNESERNVTPLVDFVKFISSTVPCEFLEFNHLSFSTQISLFQAVSERLTPNELNNHKNLYTDFYIPFLKTPNLLLLLPESMRAPFYVTIIVPYLTTNTLKLTPEQTYEVAVILAEDPFADQDHSEFFNFLVKNSEICIPLMRKNDKLMKACWGFILRSEKELKAQVARDFVFHICMILLQRSLPLEPKIFNLAREMYSRETFARKITEAEKVQIVARLAATYRRELETDINDRLALKIYQDASHALLVALSPDEYFCEACYYSITRENRGFMNALIDIFSKELGWRQMYNHIDVLLLFVQTALEVNPTAAKNSIFTHEKYDDLLVIFNRCSNQIAQHDILRLAFFQYFLSNDSKLDTFFSCITQPLHRPMFYGEFSDQAKNSVLSQIFQTYFDTPNDNISVTTLWTVFINVLNHTFIHLKDHQIVLDRIRDLMLVPEQSDFDIMFVNSKREELQNALYRLSKAIGLESFFGFISIFKNMEPGPTNCYKDVIKNVLIRYTPETRAETPEQIVNYERENPRYRLFVKGRTRLIYFVQGILCLGLVFSALMACFRVQKAAPVALGVIASMIVPVISYAPLYFSWLHDDGPNMCWIVSEIIMLVTAEVLYIVEYVLNDQYKDDAAMIVFLILFAAISIYVIIVEIIQWARSRPKKDDEKELLSGGDKDGKQLEDISEPAEAPQNSDDEIVVVEPGQKKDADEKSTKSQKSTKSAKSQKN